MRALMVQGTGSGVGKSWIATGLCRLLRRRGLRVAPFKAQNMANNAAVVLGGGEIGRAQMAQAEAAGVTATVDMNPILIKPVAHTRAQLVVRGQAISHLEAHEYWRDTQSLWALVTESYDRVASAHDIVVLEGAGSPAEFNLKDRDLVNMRMARYAAANVLLVGDVDKGGVFASFLGTLGFLDPVERELLAGFVINRFRGDPALLHPAPADFAARTGVPVRGVIPMRRDIIVDREDDPSDLRGAPGGLDVAVIRLPTIANFTDIEPLAATPGVSVRWVSTAEDLGNPDLVVLPGSKDTLGDLRALRAKGLDRVVVAAAKRTIPVLGLCGGYQMLGRRLHDPEGHGGAAGDEVGLGLLPVDTTFGPEKRLARVIGETRAGWLLPAGLTIHGYEMHQGITGSASPLNTLDGAAEGAVEGVVAGTYAHGFFDSGSLRAALVDALRLRRGLDPRGGVPLEDASAARERNYEALADLLETGLDLTGLL